MPKTFPALLLLLVAVSATSILVDRWIRAPRPRPADPVATTAPTTVEPNRDELATERASEESARGPTTPALHPQDRAGAAAVAAASASAQAAVAGKSDVVRLRGRVLDADGVGLGGSRLAVRGGWGVGWQLQGEADSDGHFDLVLPDQHMSGIVLEASHDGHVGRRWRFEAPAPAADFEVGDLSLARGTPVRGRLVRADGSSPGAGWLLRVQASPVRQEQTNYLALRVDPVEIAPDGSFEVEALPPGTTRFWAEHGSFARTDGVRRELVVGEPIELELRHDGPDPQRRLDLELAVGEHPVERVFGRDGLQLAPGSLRLESAAGAIDLLDADGRLDRERLLDLEPGRYTAVLDDPRLEPIRQENLKTGSTARLYLRGSGALRLLVVDSVSRELVPDALASVYIDPNFPGARDLPTGPVSHDPEEGPITGILPLPLRVEIRREGYQRAKVELAALEPGEERAVEVELVSDARLRVRVAAGGRPAPDANVVVVPAPGPEADSPWSRRSGANGQTDAEGQIEFRGLRLGDYVIRAWDEAGRVVQSGPTTLAKDALVDAEFDLGPLASLDVRVAGPPASSLANFQLRVTRTDATGHIETSDPRQRLAAQRFPETRTSLASDDGRFSLGSISPGTYRLHLMDSTARGLDLGTVALAPGERREVSFDVADNFAGAATMTLRVDGAPTAGATVQIVSLESGKRVEARTDADGVVRLANVGAGRWWPVVVSATAKGGWSVPLEPAIDMVAEATTQVEFSLALATGVVRLVDAAGVPLAHRSCMVVPSPTWDDPRRVQFHQGYFTDSRGELKLTLPHGEYALLAGVVDTSVLDGDRSALPKVSWPPAAEPIVVTVGQP